MENREPDIARFSTAVGKLLLKSEPLLRITRGGQLRLCMEAQVRSSNAPLTAASARTLRSRPARRPFSGTFRKNPDRITGYEGKRAAHRTCVLGKYRWKSALRHAEIPKRRPDRLRAEAPGRMRASDKRKRNARPRDFSPARSVSVRVFRKSYAKNRKSPLWKPRAAGEPGRRLRVRQKKNRRLPTRRSRKFFPRFTPSGMTAPAVRL